MKIDWINILSKGGKDPNKELFEIIKFVQFGFIWLVLVGILITVISNERKIIKLLSKEEKKEEVVEVKNSEPAPEEEIKQEPEDIVWPDI